MTTKETKEWVDDGVDPEEVDREHTYVSIWDVPGGDKMVSRESGLRYRPPHGLTVVRLKGQPRLGTVGGALARQVYYGLGSKGNRGYPERLVTFGEFDSLELVYGKDEVSLKALIEADRRGDMYPGSGPCYEWPHVKTEAVGDDEEVRERFYQRLMGKLADTHMEVEVTGFRRRYLLQFGHDSSSGQSVYRTMAPVPQASPFDAEGRISARYRDHFPPEKMMEWSAKDKDGRHYPWPDKWNKSTVSPLLYKGPAWVIRFILDGQDPLQGNRVLVTDEADYICNEWCERHNFTTYGKSYDQQSQDFDLATWIKVGLVKRQMRNRVFVPKTVQIDHFALRNLMASELKQNAFPGWVADKVLEWDFTGDVTPVDIGGVKWHPFKLTTEITVSALDPQVAKNVPNLKIGDVVTVNWYDSTSGPAFWATENYACYAFSFVSPEEKSSARWKAIAASNSKLAAVANHPCPGYGSLSIAAMQFHKNALSGNTVKNPRSLAALVELFRSVALSQPDAGKGLIRAGVDEQDARSGRGMVSAPFEGQDEVALTYADGVLQDDDDEFLNVVDERDLDEIQAEAQVFDEAPGGGVINGPIDNRWHITTNVAAANITGETI